VSEFSGKDHRQFRSSQDSLSTTFDIEVCKDINASLVDYVHEITKPFFELFNFFSLKVENVKSHIEHYLSY